MQWRALVLDATGTAYARQQPRYQYIRRNTKGKEINKETDKESRNKM